MSLHHKHGLFLCVKNHSQEWQLQSYSFPMCHIQWILGTWADLLLIQDIIEINQQLNKGKSQLYLPFAFHIIKNLSPGREDLLEGFFSLKEW